MKLDEAVVWAGMSHRREDLQQQAIFPLGRTLTLTLSRSKHQQLFQKQQQRILQHHCQMVFWFPLLKKIEDC
jgi:hypothetical protein